MQLNKNVKIAVGFAAAATLWMLTGLFTDDKTEDSKVEAKTIRVFAEKIKAEEYTPKIEVIGRTEVAEDVDLVAEVSGKVKKIDFEQGDSVKAGELMLTLENGYRKDTLTSAQETLKSAKLKLDIAQNLAKEAYKAKTDLADRQAEYTSALSNLTNAQRDYDNSFVVAPINGFVEEKNVSLGDYVKEDTVVYKIISQDEMYLVGYLSQSQIAEVKLGQNAYGIFNDGSRVDGIISFISQKADPNTKTYKMEVTVKRKDENFKVREGLTIKIYIPGDQVSVYKIPHSSQVLADDGRVGVRVVDENNTVKFYETTLVRDSHKYLLVKINTKDDINLITRGQIDVQEGMAVEVSYSDEKQTEE